MDAWLREHALGNEGRTSRTFVVPAGDGIAAFYTLATGSILRAELPGRYRHGAPNPVPVVILGRLAVDVNHQRRELGKAMLREAFRHTAEISAHAGVRALIAHAIDDAALAFYARHGFTIFPRGTRTVFLPIETVLTALAARG